MLLWFSDISKDKTRKRKLSVFLQSQHQCIVMSHEDRDYGLLKIFSIFDSPKSVTLSLSLSPPLALCRLAIPSLASLSRLLSSFPLHSSYPHRSYPHYFRYPSNFPHISFSPNFPVLLLRLDPIGSNLIADAVFDLDPMEKHENGICSAESADGSIDVWSSENLDSSSVDHLVVMVHGILGSTDDWKFGAEQFVKKLSDKVFVHCSEKNASALTLDGVDVMGERLASEVLEIIQRRPNIRKISFVAHSLGGLAARYAIGKLYKPPNEEDLKDSLGGSSEGPSKGTICGLEAVNFITVATPHLGSRGNKQVPFLFGVSSFERVAGLIIHWIFKRTGRHLFLKDEEEGKPPLLRRMVEDSGDCHFMSALRAFKRRVAYSNVGHDHIVGWRTSSIRRDSELPKWEKSLNEKYPHIVYEELCKSCDAEDIPEDDNNSDDIEEEMIKGLSSVSWEKVDVSFHTSKLRFAAHSVIQVKSEMLHIEGADVIEHIIDHFHV